MTIDEVINQQHNDSSKYEQMAKQYPQYKQIFLKIAHDEEMHEELLRYVKERI